MASNQFFELLGFTKMENQEHHHHHQDPSKHSETMSGHSQHTTHTMPDGTVMQGGGGQAGYSGGHYHSDMIADFLRRFWKSLVMTVPVVGNRI